MNQDTGTGVGSFTDDNVASVGHSRHNIGVQSDLGRLKRKYHEIRTENLQLKKETETVQSSAGFSETMHVHPTASSSSRPDAFHSCATFSDETTAASKFNGKLVESIFIIEVCAGTARLSRTAQNMGFKVMAIDHSSRRSSCGMPIQCFELEDPAQVEALADLFQLSITTLLLFGLHHLVAQQVELANENKLNWKGWAIFFLVRLDLNCNQTKWMGFQELTS